MSTGVECDATFKRNVLFSCYDALAAVGFVRYRKENVDWPLSDGFHCWVGLNSGLEPEYVEVNPFVGIHVVPIMKFYTALEGRKYDRGIATYAVHMGTLASSVPTFRFTRQSDVPEEANRLARLYSSIGLSYAQSIASYERLLPLLQDRLGMLGAYPERVAACLYLMDRKEESRHFVEEFLRQHRGYFEGFAVPFLKHLGSAGRGSANQSGGV